MYLPHKPAIAFHLFQMFSAPMPWQPLGTKTQTAPLTTRDQLHLIQPSQITCLLYHRPEYRGVRNIRTDPANTDQPRRRFKIYLGGEKTCCHVLYTTVDTNPQPRLPPAPPMVQSQLCLTLKLFPWGVHTLRIIQHHTQRKELLVAVPGVNMSGITEAHPWDMDPILIIDPTPR